jgi:hypothetical protein
MEKFGMRKYWSFFPLLLAVALNLVTPAHAVDMDDPYLPSIKSISIDFAVEALNAADKSVIYPIIANVEVVAKVHRRSLAGFSVTISAREAMPTSKKCNYVSSDEKSISPVNLSAGVVIGTSDPSALPVLRQLVSKTKDGDWRIEKYQFSFPIGRDSKLEPCITDFNLDSLYFIDEGLREKSIMLNVGSTPFYEMYTRYADESKQALLPESKCAPINLPDFPGSQEACEDNLKNLRLLPGFTEAKLKRAKDLLIAKNAALRLPPASPQNKSQQKKLETIRCQKGSTIKKVMGYGPVCPKGYSKI